MFRSSRELGDDRYKKSCKKIFPPHAGTEFRGRALRVRGAASVLCLGHADWGRGHPGQAQDEGVRAGRTEESSSAHEGPLPHRWTPQTQPVLPEVWTAVLALLPGWEMVMFSERTLLPLSTERPLNRDESVLRHSVPSGSRSWAAAAQEEMRTHSQPLGGRGGGLRGAWGLYSGARRLSS